MTGKQELDRVKSPRNPIRRSEFVQRLMNLWTYEKKLQPNAGWALRLASLRRGFTTDSYLMYRGAKHDLALCVNDWVRYIKAPDINDGRKGLIKDKSLFATWFGGILPVPESYGVLLRGRFIPFSGMEDLATLKDLLCAKAFGAVVFKPTGGGSGNSIFIAKWEGDRFIVNGKETTTEQFEQQLTKQREMLASRFVTQAEYARKIFPQTTNTLRVLTMIDPQSDEAFVAKVIHRFGSKESIPVDNFKQGGLVVSVDAETGVMGQAAVRTQDGGVEYTDRHPETDEVVTGVQVPHWGLIRDRLLAAVNVIGVLPYVGWDVVVTDGGFSVLEGNSCTGVNILQLHEPLLADPRVRRFYEHHGIIRRR